MIIIEHLLIYILYFILFERSEVRLHLFVLIAYAKEKLRNSCFKLELHLSNEYSVLLRKSVLRNYVIIKLL